MCDLVKQIRVMCDWNLPPPFAILFTYMIFIYLQSFIYVNFSRVFNIANQ